MGMEDTSEESVSETHDELGKEDRQSVQGYVAIKGTRNGLLLTLEPETPFGELLNALSQRLAEAPGFFRGASLAVDTTQRRLRVSERTQLEALLAHYQMSVTSSEPVTTTISSPFPGDPSPATQVTNGRAQPYQRDPRDSLDTPFLRRTFRSCQSIHHASHIVVMGDVNP